MSLAARLVDQQSVALASLASVTLPHEIYFDGQQRIPNKVRPNQATRIRVTAVTDTDVTYFNPGSVAESALFWVQLDHSVQRDALDTPAVDYWQGASAGFIVVAQNFQQTYDAGAGPTTPIQFDTTRNGIRLLGAVGVVNPLFEIIDQVGATVMRVDGNPPHINIGTAAVNTSNMIFIDPSAFTAKDGIRILQSASTGRGIRITMSAGSSGQGLFVEGNSTGGAVQVTCTSSGAGITISYTGTAIALTISSSSTTSTTSILSTTNTAVIANTWSRSPTVVTAGTHVRLTQNSNFSGIGLEILMGGGQAGEQGISLVTRTLGFGFVMFDTVASTGIGMRLQRNVTGSTGILLDINKSPPGATAGDLIQITTNGNASGNIFNITAAGSGSVLAPTNTGTGRFLTLSHTGSGEIWRITGAAGVIRSVMDTNGRFGLGVVPASPARLAIKEHTAFAGSEAQTTTGSGNTVGAVTANILTLALADNTTYLLEAHITGRDAAGVDRAVYVVRALVFRQAAGAATLGAASPANDFTDETAAGFNGTIVVAANNAIVQTLGMAGVTMAWVCTLEWQAVSTSA